MHIITHANRIYSDHISWKDIELFKRFLYSTNSLSNIVAMDYATLQDLEDYDVIDTLTIFVTGTIDKTLVDLSSKAKKVIVMIPDIDWQLSFNGLNPDVIFTNCNVSQSLYADVCKQLTGCDDIASVKQFEFIPYGALGIIDSKNIDSMREIIVTHPYEPMSRVYMGSNKTYRDPYLDMLMSSNDVTIFGNLPASLTKYAQADIRGWIPPDHSLAVYDAADTGIVITGPLNLLRGDYNRIYEMGLGHCTLELHGQSKHSFLDEWSDVLHDDYSFDIVALYDRAYHLMYEQTPRILNCYHS